MGRYGKRADLSVHEEEPFNGETRIAAGIALADALPRAGPPHEAAHVGSAGADPWRRAVDGRRSRNAT
jgi:hypothetical protein